MNEQLATAVTNLINTERGSVYALAAQPREVDMDEYRAMVAAMEQIDPATLPGLTAAQRCALGRFAKPDGEPAWQAEPVAWVAADTLNSPHPTCVSSLAYMSQIDQDRGREYVPLYAAPVATQASADMFWSVDNPEEWGGESLHDAVHYAADNFSANDVPFELTFQAAKRMPNVRVRVTGYSESDGWRYEIIDAAMQRTAAREGEQ